MQSVEQLQDLIDRDLILESTVTPLTTSYSLETVRSTLASLCPPASHCDNLSSAQLSSITQSTPLTISAGDVMTVLEKRCCRRLWLDLCYHEGYLSSQWGLQRPSQPAAGHFLQPDALRVAALTSLAPYAIRLCPQ